MEKQNKPSPLELKPNSPSGRNSEAEIGIAKEPKGDYCDSRMKVDAKRTDEVSKVRRRKKKHRIFSPIYLTLVLIILYLPILMVVIYSFNSGRTIGAWQGFTTFDTRNMPADRPFGSGTASPRHTELPT